MKIKDKDVALKKIANDGVRVFNELSCKLLADKGVVLAGVRKSGYVLRHASAKLRGIGKL